MKELKLTGILEGGKREIEVNVDELVYRSYKYQRDRNPEIEPDRWALCFPRTKQLEERYQQEKAPAAPTTEAPNNARFYRGTQLDNQTIH